MTTPCCAAGRWRACARSGDPATIAGYMGKSDVFDKALAAFGKTYADQTEKDQAHSRLFTKQAHPAHSSLRAGVCHLPVSIAEDVRDLWSVARGSQINALVLRRLDSRLNHAALDPRSLHPVIGNHRVACCLQTKLKVNGPKGDMDGAIAEYRTSIRIDPNQALSASDLGSVLLQKGDVDGAIAEFRTAIRLNPNDAYAHSRLGEGLEMKGQLNEALDEYRSAMALDPKLSDGMAKTRYEKLAVKLHKN